MRTSSLECGEKFERQPEVLLRAISFASESLLKDASGLFDLLNRKRSIILLKHAKSLSIMILFQIIRDPVHL